ncbi:DUF3784 domain-containing protein [Romboutsia weinsteinii]|uniref:DUF3784 domain-containing protein n=1 Tax=Romboutsia weinsteinii TaxID=2020949 RepID=A0A255IMP5_9FIRM|nr:DUF3784 domain-containing protein [Romboutsia weinsteinii]RDY27746.1 DUF3784 domain-containing protein [Romboutsia weinsteinii]
MLSGIIYLVISVACLVYSLFAFQEKGPLLMTTYFVASPKEREKMKNRKEYRFVATVFITIAVATGIAGLGEIFNIAWAYKVTMAILLVLVVYVIVVSIKDSIKK